MVENWITYHSSWDMKTSISLKSEHIYEWWNPLNENWDIIHLYLVIFSSTAVLLVVILKSPKFSSSSCLWSLIFHSSQNTRWVFTVYFPMAVIPQSEWNTHMYTIYYRDQYSVSTSSDAPQSQPNYYIGSRLMVFTLYLGRQLRLSACLFMFI